MVLYRTERSSKLWYNTKFQSLGMSSFFGLFDFECLCVAFGVNLVGTYKVDGIPDAKSERKEVVLKTDFLSSSVQMDVRGAGRGHQLKSGNAIGGFCHHQATGIGSVMPPPIIFQASALLILVLPKSAVSPRRPS
ncbi:hypothetical protein MUK42_05776 [Musa troglodytarum]|uniref:Uncharacterized protein n=1 Tax=Musa troglodytarum TaxID=320322 RepID=A0A9E7I9Q3_9LILI|nr:hypothetical protein MUK42_05776 [Musa troglodytarum]